MPQQQTKAALWACHSSYCKAAVCVPLSPCAACRYVEEAEVDDEAEVTADIDEEVRQQDIAGFSEACQQDGAEQLAMSGFTCI